MTPMCCLTCGPLRLATIGGEHVIEEAGRRWVFEHHAFIGPVVLRKDGTPSKRQPGSRSPFWRAFDAWRARKGPAR